jgi:hypothetical protein
MPFIGPPRWIGSRSNTFVEKSTPGKSSCKKLDFPGFVDIPMGGEGLPFVLNLIGPVFMLFGVVERHQPEA